jgi:tripartite-type tricarboxylate transporter receptor subunit TctC
VSLWNGLFVHKDTPADVREKIIAVAKETMVSDRAKKLSADTGAIVYWKDAEAAARQIESDKATIAKINAMIAN